MPTTKYTDLATYLRSWGLKVQEVSGWQTRSSNWSKSFTPKGVVCHHTAGPAAGGNYPSYNTVLNGRSNLQGPLSQFGLGRDGTVILIGAHRANHAGTGGPLVGIPKDSANAYMWGIEAENSGHQSWPAVQMQAYYKLVAALASYSKAPFAASMVIGHKEWAPGRKPDPSFSMSNFRTQVQAAKNKGPKPPPKPTKPPTSPPPHVPIGGLSNPPGTPRHPLYIGTLGKACDIEAERRTGSLDDWEALHVKKVLASIAYDVRQKQQKPYQSPLNLVKQLQIAYLGYTSRSAGYGKFDAKTAELLVKHNGYTIFDGKRTLNGIQ